MIASTPSALLHALPAHASTVIAASGPVVDWSDLWSQVLQRAAPAEPSTLVSLWPAAVIVLLTLVWARAHRWGRTLVTVVHEAGHAAVGVLVGRRFQGFVVSQDLSGRAVTSGKPRGLGRVLTAWAGYPAPALLGAAVVAAVLRGWSGTVLAVALAALLVLLVMSRSLRTAGVVLAVGVLTAALWWLGGALRAGFLAGVGLVLLMGAWGSLGDVARSADPHQDHGTLAQLTWLPAGFWLVTWFLADAAATACVVRLVWGLLA